MKTQLPCSRRLSKEESFWATMKSELIGDRIFTSCTETKTEIFCYIEIFYNRQRLAQALASNGITMTAQAVHGFVKHRLKRRYALGMGPNPSPAHPPLTASPEMPEFTESPPPPSEHCPAPLTLPPKRKTKATWTVLKPTT